jgi:hypothetical protein
MRLPRLNRLTSLHWAKNSPRRDDSDASFLKQDAVIQSVLLHPKPCAIGKIGTSELLVLEYPERWIRPAERLFNSVGALPLR